MKNLTIHNEHIDQADLNFESHKLGTNWIAIVTFDPGQPGGLDRDFFEKGSGSFRKVPESLKPGDVLEVAYDYTSWGGNLSRRRSYYRVISISDEQLSLEEVEKPGGKDNSENAHITLALVQLSSFCETITEADLDDALEKDVIKKANALFELLSEEEVSS